MTLLVEAFCSWLLEQLAEAARKRSGKWLLGDDQERALRAVGQAAVTRTACELRPGASDADIEHLAQILEEVFRARMPAVPLESHATLLQALQAGMTAQLAVLGDAALTGTEHSAAQVLGLSVEQVTKTLTRQVVQEILVRGAAGGALGPLADQLNHDLTHLQGQHNADMLDRIVEELGHLRRRRRPVARPIPRELPRPLADFTGRGDELTMLRTLLDPRVDRSSAPSARSDRPVVISAIDGMGGIGKSSLAIQSAHELVNASAFPDGQLYVNLRGSTPGLPALQPIEALGRMLRALGLEAAAIPTEVEEASARFRSLAAKRRLLMLLDNAHNSEQVRPLLPGSATCSVLVTSRQALTALEGAHLFHLDVLSPDQALELLGRIAGQERIAQQARAAVEVVRWCGYLPLAVRIAGARLAARPSWPVEALERRLADAGRRLEELQVGDRAVRASFEVSWHALRESPDSDDQAAAAVFGVCSLSDGPDLSLAAAARLLDRTELSTEALLERLVDAHLLEEPQPGRYRFHDLMRDYARGLTDRHDSPRTRIRAIRRLLEFYLSATRTAEQTLRPFRRPPIVSDAASRELLQVLHDPAAARAWFDAERPNLVACALRAGQDDQFEHAALLPQVLTPYLQMAGHMDEALLVNQSALDYARRVGNRQAEGDALQRIGEVQELTGRHDDGLVHFREARSIFGALGDRGGEATALQWIGETQEVTGKYDDGLANFTEALTIFREVDDRWGEAKALQGLGDIEELKGNYAYALAYHGKALIFFRHVGDRQGEAAVLQRIGDAEQLIGRYEKALGHLRQALLIQREVRSRLGEAAALKGIGVVEYLTGNYGAALAHLRESQAICIEIGDRIGEANALRRIGEVERLTSQHNEALAHLRQALAIYQEIGDRFGEANALWGIGEAERATDRIVEALAHLRQALAIYQEIGNRPGEANARRAIREAKRASDPV